METMSSREYMYAVVDESMVFLDSILIDRTFVPDMEEAAAFAKKLIASKPEGWVLVVMNKYESEPDIDLEALIDDPALVEEFRVIQEKTKDGNEKFKVLTQGETAAALKQYQSNLAKKFGMDKIFESQGHRLEGNQPTDGQPADTSLWTTK